MKEAHVNRRSARAERHVGLDVMVRNAMPPQASAMQRSRDRTVSAYARASSRGRTTTLTADSILETALRATTELDLRWVHEVKDDDLMAAMAQVPQRGQSEFAIEQQNPR